MYAAVILWRRLAGAALLTLFGASAPTAFAAEYSFNGLSFEIDGDTGTLSRLS